MKKIIVYIFICLTIVLSPSCDDSLRIDERQTSFDVNYFTYSRYQLTTAIVNTAQSYGTVPESDPDRQVTLYFMNCYSGDQTSTYYTVFQNNWGMKNSNPYTNQFRTFAAIHKVAEKEGNTATIAAADILKAFITGFLTEKYGDIPFSEAMLGREGSLFPKFDSQKEVYESLFALLDNAVSVLSNSSSKGLPADHDVLFNGDRTKWIKFANSLKFRLMVHSYEAFKKDGTDLSSQMEAIASGNNYMNSVADNASITFPGTKEGDSWYLQTTWGTGNKYTRPKPTKYLIDQMKEFDDPRMYVIFAPVLAPLSSKTEQTTEQVKINGFTYDITYYPVSDPGVQPGWLTTLGKDLSGNDADVSYELDAQWFGTPTPIDIQNTYGGGSHLAGTQFPYDNRRITSFSKLIAKTKDNRLRAVMMEASEMMFLLAEARQKGWISSGTVKNYYEQGIKLSFERWEIENGTKPATHIGSDKIVDDFAAYYAKPGVALDGSSADLDKIALQKWLSLLVTNHAEAFTEVRRTKKPDFVYTLGAAFSSYDFPMRYTYPLDEESNNRENYDAAVSALGGKDIPSAKMWIFK
jgi:hypothetical protein